MEVTSGIGQQRDSIVPEVKVQGGQKDCLCQILRVAEKGEDRLAIGLTTWSGLAAQEDLFLWVVARAQREGPLSNWRQSRATFCRKFARKRSRCEVGAGEGGGVKRVFLDGGEAACLSLRRMMQQRRDHGGCQGDTAAFRRS